MRKWLIAAAALLVACVPLASQAQDVVQYQSPTVRFVYPAGTTFTTNVPTLRTGAFGYPTSGFVYSYPQNNNYATYSNNGGWNNNYTGGWNFNYASGWNGNRGNYWRGWDERRRRSR